MKKFFNNEMWRKVASALLIQMVFVAVMIPVLCSNVDFVVIRWERNKIADSICTGSMNVEEMQVCYTESLAKMEQFAEQGDYQKWMVQSNNTSVGQYVVGIVFIIEVLAFVLAIYLVFCNMVAFIKLNGKILDKAKAEKSEQPEQ